MFHVKHIEIEHNLSIKINKNDNVSRETLSNIKRIIYFLIYLAYLF